MRGSFFWRALTLAVVMVAGAAVFVAPTATAAPRPTVAAAATEQVYLENDVPGPKCLDQDYSGNVEHREVLAWTCTFGYNELWLVTPSSKGGSIIVNYLSDECLDQDYSDNVEHSDVIAYTCDWTENSPNQRWYFNSNKTITNALSGKCLDEDFSGGVAHSDLLAWTCASSPGANERWSKHY
ncbi:RICIN domain-containing protein [Streptomyces sp. NBC_00986]|uniref:RICIN domain-containing protein n=1 Tax=Streptomyces sp. NBC_00986 TaxID=2903702 RepID=UPI00386D0E7E|nr:ricin-type beta-trefoil lectin domain protein [Streptomyces sp. NBC_00986]